MTAASPFSPATISPPCGCRISGDGHVARPLRIIFCARHVVLNDISDLAPVAADGHAQHQSARSRAVTAQGELLAAVLEEIREAVPVMVGGSGAWEITRGSERSLALAISLAPPTAGQTRAVGVVSLFDIPSQAGLGKPSVCTPEWAADRFGLLKILDAIADKLDECRGHGKAAAKIEKSAGVARAVVTLLKAGHKNG